MSGVLPTGFVPKTQQQIFNDEVTSAQALIKKDLDLSPVSPTGQELGIAATETAEVWEVGQVSYNATNRGAAEGAQLDNVGALQGCKRQPATYSQVWTSCTFTAAGTYAKGALVGFIAGLSSQSASNLAAVVVPSTHPANGNPVSNTNPYVTGTTYAPATLFQAPLTGPNFGNALVAANAGNPGNVGAFTGQIPVTGWTALIDLSSPTIGAPIETDTAYRVRQAQQLGAAGSCTLDALRVDVIDALAVAPSPVIASVEVVENASPNALATGQPANSFRVIVFDGTNPNRQQDDPIIAQTIWNNKPAGIPSYGASSAIALDSQGIQRTVYFDRPTQIPLYLILNVQIQATATTAQVVQAITVALFAASQGKAFSAYGATVQPAVGSPVVLLPGTDAVGSAWEGIAQAQAGVVKVTSVLQGTTPVPTSQSDLRATPTQIFVMTGVVVNCTVFSP